MLSISVTVLLVSMRFSFLCSKDTPDTSTPVPASSSPVLSLLPFDFASNLTAELYPLQSGDQLPLGLLGDETPSETTF